VLPGCIYRPCPASNHTTMSDSPDTCLHVRLLLEHGQIADGQRPSVNHVAQQIGMPHQTLSRLYTGKSRNVRLQTARALCNFYGIALDYFACADESACLQYLAQRQHRESHVAEIDREAAQLSETGQRNVMTVLQWLVAGKSDG